MPRSSRSLKVRLDRIETVKNALRRNNFQNQSALAEDACLARDTVNKFLNGKPVDRASFNELCRRLALSWQDIAEIPYPMICQRQDWGEAVDVSTFYGRTEERETLKQWIVEDRCRLVAVCGIGGIGKTTLSVKLAEEILNEFDYLMWRSLRNSLPLEVLLTDAIATFSNQQSIILPDAIEKGISQLIDCCRQSRCLLILDNFESILDSERLAGNYRQGYEGYQQLLNAIGETRHQSCLLLTTREQPNEISIKEGNTRPVRSLPLKGLKLEDSKEILLAKDLSGSEDEIKSLSDRYAGNPLALQIVAPSIRDVFNSNIAVFLEQQIIVRNLSNLLNEQFDRLSSIEKQLMYWLAIRREGMSLVDLQECLVSTISTGDLVDALTSLRSRSLIELVEQEDTTLFSQHSAIMEYVIQRFIDQLYHELIAGKIDLLDSCNLLTIQTKDYVQQEQIRLILQPIVDRLLALLGNVENAQKHLKQLISTLQHTHRNLGYAGENLTIISNFLLDGIIKDTIRKIALPDETTESQEVIH